MSGRGASRVATCSSREEARAVAHLHGRDRRRAAATAGRAARPDEREQTQSAPGRYGRPSRPQGVILSPATNRPTSRSALLAPAVSIGRMSCPPDVKGREEILRVHPAHPAGANVATEGARAGDPGFPAPSGEPRERAALLAARQNKSSSRCPTRCAKDKVLMGVERRSMIISDAESGRSPTTRPAHARRRRAAGHRPVTSASSAAVPSA